MQIGTCSGEFSTCKISQQSDTLRQVNGFMYLALGLSASVHHLHHRKTRRADLWETARKMREALRYHRETRTCISTRGDRHARGQKSSGSASLTRTQRRLVSYSTVRYPEPMEQLHFFSSPFWWNPRLVNVLLSSPAASAPVSEMLSSHWTQNTLQQD